MHGTLDVRGPKKVFLVVIQLPFSVRQRPGSVPITSLNKFTAMLIDDDEASGEIIEKYLDNMNCHSCVRQIACRRVRNGKIRRSRFDLAVIDSRMMDQPGYEQTFFSWHAACTAWLAALASVAWCA